jgi:hypothetical protein
MIVLLVWTCGPKQDNFLLFLIEEVWEPLKMCFSWMGGRAPQELLHALSTHFVLAILNIFCLGNGCAI